MKISSGKICYQRSTVNLCNHGNNFISLLITAEPRFLLQKLFLILALIRQCQELLNYSLKHFRNSLTYGMPNTADSTSFTLLLDDTATRGENLGFSEHFSNYQPDPIASIHVH